MIDQQAAIDAVLDGVVPIGDDPRVAGFEQAVAEHIAARPSPEPRGPSIADRLAAVELRVAALDGKVDEVLTLLRGGAM